MKERRYKDDWINEVRLDEKTGRDQRVPIYKGSWFDMDREGRRLASGGSIWVPLLACGGLLVLFFLLDDAGTRSLPVFLCAAIALFPLLYWGLGAWTVSRIKGPFTRLQREKGYGRMLRSSMGCFLFLGIACLSDLVRVLTGGGGAGDFMGLGLLLAADLAAFTAFRQQRRIDRHIAEQQGGTL